MRSVPDYPPEWERWRDQALLYRITTRDLIEHDFGARADVLAMAADDPCYDQLVFGTYFEPRDRIGRPKGWYPAIPFEFQVRAIRWIEDVIATIPGTPGALLGRGDGILEKSRDMTGTWSFINVLAHRWKYDDGFVGGMMSYKEDAVEKANSPGTLFYKLEGYLGLDLRVPEVRPMLVAGDEEIVPVRSPAWMIPEGYDEKQHNQHLTLAHPTKTNVIDGYTTTPRSTVGFRLTLLFLDEGGKFTSFQQVWNDSKAVTDHLLTCSSADTRYGLAFRDAARHADRSNQKGEKGPAFMRLRAEDHPFRDEIWREEMEARHDGSEEAAQSLAREFDLDYDAGHGAFIYPAAKTIEPIPLTFNPANETLDFTIDPATSRDLCAIHLIKYDHGTDRYGLMASYAKTGVPAEFYASLVVATPMSGTYEYGEDEFRIMEWFERYGRAIRFWVGDPAGKSRVGSHRNGKLTSFYDDFRDATRELTDGRRSIAIYSSDKHEFKRNPNRWAALRWLLEKTDFNDVPDVRRTLAGIQDHRLPARSESRETTSEQGEPIRHPLFDRVTALEYYAAHRKIGYTMDRLETPAPVRLSMSGKPWGARKKAGFITRTSYS